MGEQMFMTLRDQDDWLNSQAAVWYEEGKSKLVSRYDKCLSVQGDYVEKWVKVCHKTCIFCFFPVINKNIFVWQNVLYFLDAARILLILFLCSPNLPVSLSLVALLSHQTCSQL